MSAADSDPASIKNAIRLYRALLILYPPDFRQEYGGEMELVFRESLLNAALRPEPGSLALFGLRTLSDYILSLLEQHTNRGIEMTYTKWIQLSGWALAASGLLFLFSWLAGSRPIYAPYSALSWPIDRFLNLAVIPTQILSLLLSAAGILGLRARYASSAGALGRSGLLVCLGGCTVSTLGLLGSLFLENSPWWELNMAGATALFSGLVLFGVNCLRLRVLPRWNFLPLLTGLPWVLAILTSLAISATAPAIVNIPDQVGAVLLFISFGGLALIGYRLQADAGAKAAYPPISVA